MLPFPQTLQEEPTATCSQLTELMMSSRVTLTDKLPRDLADDAIISRGSFLINLEGASGSHPYTAPLMPACLEILIMVIY